MGNAIKGITVEIGGDTTKLGKALQGVNTQSTNLQKELKGVNTLLKMDPGNVTLLAQKQDILSQAIANTKSKLDTLRGAQEQVEKQFANGDIGAEEYRDFQREIIATEKKLEGFKEELDGIDESTDDIKKVEGAVEDVGDAAENSSGGFTVMKGALGDLVSNAIQGAISAVGDFVGELMELSEATEEYRSMQAKIAGSAESFGYSTDFAKGKYEEFYKYVGDDQMATNAITNLMGLGTSTESVSALAEGAIGVWASYGDSIPIEGLTEAINETVQCGKVTGTFADTINWAKTSNEQLLGALDGNSKAQKAFNDAIKDGESSEDAFNAALEKTTSEQERADIVAKFLNSTYGESKKTYDEMSGSITSANEAELQLKQTQADLGETLAPVNTAFTNLKNQALQAIAPIVEKVADGFMKLYEWLQKNPTAMAIITGIVIGLATAFGVLATALLIQGLINGVTAAIAFLNTTLLANPIVLIVAAIAGLVAAFIYLWNNCEGFRNFFINLWDTIKNAAINAWNAITEFFTVTLPAVFTGVIDWIKANWQNILLFLINPFAGLFKYFYDNNTKFKEFVNNIWNSIVEFFTGIIDWVKANWQSILAFFINPFAGLFKYFYDNNTKFKEFVDNAIKYIKELPGKVWTWLLDVINKVHNWHKDMITKAVEMGKQFVTKIVNFVKELPSKIWTWLVNVITKINNWHTNMINKAKEVASGFINKVVEFIKQLPSKIWSFLTNVVSKVASWGSSLASKGKQAATKLFNAVVNKIKEIPGKVKSIAKDLVTGLWNGISDKFEWLTGKIKGFATDVTDKLKSFFGIKSPSRVMRDEVGKMLGEGIAVGINQSKDTVLNSLNSLVTDSRTEVQKVQDDLNKSMLESERLYAEESERLKDSKSEADKEYLENLKTTAEQERKIYDARIKDQENLKKSVVDTYNEIAEECYSNIEDLEKAQSDFAKKLSDFGGLTSTVKIESSVDTREFTTLADLNEQNDTLERYRDLLLQIKDRENVPQEFFTTLRGMGVEDGITFAETLLKADENTFNKYIADWQEKQRLASEISKTLYQDEADALAEEITTKFDTVTEEFFGVGSDSADQFEDGFIEQLSTVVTNIKNSLASSLSGLYSSVNSAFSGVSSIVSIGIPQAAKGGIVNRPTFLQAGEDGAEAIIPLENNTGWIDSLAQKINSYQPQSGGVVNNAMLDKLDSIYERLGRMQMVTDTGALVGEILDKIDNGLAEKQLLNARGV